MLQSSTCIQRQILSDQPHSYGRCSSFATPLLPPGRISAKAHLPPSPSCLAVRISSRISYKRKKIPQTNQCANQVFKQTKRPHKNRTVNVPELHNRILTELSNKCRWSKVPLEIRFTMKASLPHNNTEQLLVPTGEKNVAIYT